MTVSHPKSDVESPIAGVQNLLLQPGFNHGIGKREVVSLILTGSTIFSMT